MRELKFRAWDTKDKCWVYGYETLGGFSLIGEVTLMGELGRPKLEKLLTDILFMQYTGLKDKSGKEIYEGDILRDADLDHWCVVFIDGSFWLQNPDDQSNRNTYDWLSDTGDWNHEVIGNIYENPDLIN